MAHGKWLRSQTFAKPGVQFAFDEAYDTVLTTLARRDRLDTAILAMAADVIVVLTDGANTQGVDPKTAAAQAARGVRFYTIGFGTTTPTRMACTGAQVERWYGGGPPGGGAGTRRRGQRPEPADHRRGGPAGGRRRHRRSLPGPERRRADRGVRRPALPCDRGPPEDRPRRLVRRRWRPAHRHRGRTVVVVEPGPDAAPRSRVVIPRSRGPQKITGCGR